VTDKRGERLRWARSWLFVPGGADRFVAKLTQVRPGAAILDLEDGLAVTDLIAGRVRVSDLLSADGPPQPVPLAVRCHAVGHPAFEADLRCLGPRLAALFVPKVGDASEVREVADRLADAGFAHVPLVAIIESAIGVERAFDILGAHPTVMGAAFGGEDFAADLGLPPELALRGARDGSVDGESAHGKRVVLNNARARLVTAAAARGLRWVIDTPSLALDDVRAAEEGARRSRSMGFTGKFAIHPAQVASIESGFTPSDAEVAWARTVLSGRASAAGATRGGTSEDTMVDEAVLRQARSVLEDMEG